MPKMVNSASKRNYNLNQLPIFGGFQSLTATRAASGVTPLERPSEELATVHRRFAGMRRSHVREVGFVVRDSEHTAPDLAPAFTEGAKPREGAA